MKKYIITLIITLLVIGGTERMVAADEIIMGTGDWCPYVCDPTLHHGKHGYLPDIARIIFENGGHSFTMRYMTFVRVVEEARKGKLTGIPGVYQGDVPDFIFPSSPQGIGMNTFYVRKDSSWRFENVDSLQSLKRLGVIRDYFYGDAIQQFIEKFPSQIEVLHGDDPQTRSLKKLQIGRIDAWIEDNQVAQYNLTSMKLGDEIIPAGHIGAELFVYIAFSPAESKAQDYAQLITEGVEKLRQSGELEKILAVYGLHDWKK